MKGHYDSPPPDMSGRESLYWYIVCLPQECPCGRAFLRRYNRAQDRSVFNALLSARSSNSSAVGGDGFDMFEHPTRAVSLSLYSISKFVQLVCRVCGGGGGDVWWRRPLWLIPPPIW